MTCPRPGCGAWAWQERDPEYGDELVCLSGHRVSDMVPLPKNYNSAEPKYESKRSPKSGQVRLL